MVPAYFTGLLGAVAIFAGVVNGADIAAIAASTISPATFLASPPMVNDAIDYSTGTNFTVSAWFSPNCFGRGGNG